MTIQRYSVAIVGVPISYEKYLEIYNKPDLNFDVLHPCDAIYAIVGKTIANEECPPYGDLSNIKSLSIEDLKKKFIQVKGILLEELDIDEEPKLYSFMQFN
ncbi:hypothetical protein [Paenibacillus polymyxa]|uniref:Uncharacterized protein n=1 Tax=Paenibacillus polymyxa (strain SC2) TaxID=886882 RepID=E3EKX3_PAEPS|nr:hypothetical protein [Paenibacillus polymyxa]ADO59878.1 hypothetical protein PPSC2_25775 [Paenibacillus polymyxa SC2]WPQ59896.1 hypothetical protein SKN87_26975 [Paenibacillus polymyxa]